MPRTRHTLPALIALLGLIALLLPLTFDRADAVAVPQTLIAGPDYARNVLGDAWDMSNSSDMNLDPSGPTLYVTNTSLSGGVARFSTSKVSYVSLLWAGVPGSLPWGRDGRLRQNQIVASSYSRFHGHLYASRTTTIWLIWTTTCAGCSGHTAITLNPGWNDVDLSLTQAAHSGTAWSGNVTGLKLQVMTSVATSVQIDDVRVYRRATAGVLTWAAPGSKSAHLYWSDSGTFSSATGQHSGVVPTSTSTSSSHPVNTDVSGYEPTTSFFSYDGSTAVKVGVIAREPMPVIDSPTARGCGDYAVAARSLRWVFPSPSRLAGKGNVTNLTYSTAGVFSATNAAPQRNDPWATMPLGSTGIDGRAWHRLTIVESYDGGFGLANAPGGGTMARVLWKEPGHSAWSQTNDLVTPTGKQTITLDMAMPASILTEPDGTAAQRYPFASTSRVTTLRWDPNEDPGSRRWHLYSVVLAKDCLTKVSFPMTWHDTRYVAGSTASIVARSPGGHTYPLVSGLIELAGTNTYRIVASRLPVNTYTIRVTVRTPAGATHTSEAGPLVVGRP